MMSRPPKPAELCESAVKLPEELDAFLYTLLTGNTQIPAEYPDCVRRLVDSFGQDIVYSKTTKTTQANTVTVCQCSTYPDVTPMWAWDRSFS